MAGPRISRLARKLLYGTFHVSICRSRILTRLIFGISPGQLVLPDHFAKVYFDMTTLLLRQILGHTIRPGMKMAEVGVGKYSLLSGYCAKKGCTCWASDIYHPAVKNSAKVARKNGLNNIRFTTGDLLKSLDENVDCIFWNLPYYDLKCYEFIKELQ